MKPKVSIIIPTYNEENNIGRLLKSIKLQSYKNIETIVVDDGSTDKTVEISKKFTKKVFARSHAERSIQRNFGASVSSGEYLLFLDADMQLSKNVVRECVEATLKNKKVGSITIPEEPVAKSFWEKVKKHEREFYNLDGDIEVESARFFPKKVFLEVGGYDEKITGPEDWDLPETISKNGYKNLRTKSKIRHFERVSSLFSLMNKKYYYGLKSYVYFEKQNIPLVSSKTIYFLRPVFYKNWRKLLSNPALSFSMIVMLISEQIAGGLGFFKGKLFKSNSVLILTAHFSPNVGGVETHLDDYVDVLKKKNFDVTVLTYIPLTSKAKYKLFEESKTKKIIRIPWPKDLFYKLVDIPFLEFIYIFPGLFIVLPFVIIWRRPSSIHSHGLVAGSVGMFWSKVFGLRSVLSTHSMYQFPNSGVYFSFAKFVFSNTDKILVLSEQSKKEIENLTRRNDIIKFTYWIDLDSFTKAKRSSKNFIVLFVGRLVEIKGIKLLIESAKTWDKQIFLEIIGTGPLQKFVEDNQSINIKYLGKIENSKLSEYYSRASLVIVPSVNEEGFGRVILEALASSTPVIASNLGGIPEAMNNKVGKLIRPTKLNIKNSVEYFYKNRSKLEALSKNASNFAQEKYSEENAEKIIRELK